MREELTHFYDVTLTPIGERILREKFAANPPNDPGQLRRDVDDVINQVFRDLEPVTNRFLQSYSMEVESIRGKSVNSPLEEKWARLKFFLDFVAMKTRVFLFVVGLLLFLASIILRIISQPDIAKVV